MIKKCEKIETEKIYEIINDAAMAYKGIIPPDRWKEPYMPMVELQEEINHGVEFFGYYDEKNNLVGVMGKQSVQDVMLIRHAYVYTKQRGNGIGSKLLDYILEINSKPVLIGTWIAAEWAIRFYEKNGFEVADREETIRLLKKYWEIPKRQIETSVVLKER